MKTAQTAFKSEEEIRKYVEACEAEYLADVKAAATFALSGGNIITLCGPSCSGKTTTAKILDEGFSAAGKELHPISIDDFYYNRDYLIAKAMAWDKEVDYDSPSTIDLELFARVVDQIEKKEPVSLPKFDFVSGNRRGFETIKITDGDIFLFEGIQAVYPSLTRFLASHNYTSLFISVESSIYADGKIFEPREIRFLRRMVRDARTRNTSAEGTFELWQGVVSNEDRHIYPNLSGIHKRIDSTMAYELSVIKPFALPLLMGIEADSEYKADAEAIIKKLENIPIIDEKFVPSNSVFREFIGEGRTL